ncbi:MAG: LuxR C-terminal-related transcriptional regulator [Oscillospiraceae bacterium]|jgi:DNA-binding CsgD family transcriptional regulator/ligand-binding sensor protein
MKAATQMKCQEWVSEYGKNKLQSLLDACAGTLNISLGLITPYGDPITVWSNSSLLCEKIRSSNAESCQREMQNILKYTCGVQKTVKYECYMGITTFACPVIYEGDLVALCLGGGIVEEENVDANVPQEIPRVSRERLEEIISLVSCIMNILSSAGGVDEKEHVERQEGEGVDLMLLRNKLSVREMEVVRLINFGLSNKEISSELNISEKTVKTHITNILRKLNLKDRLEIILYCKNNCVS